MNGTTAPTLIRADDPRGGSRGLSSGALPTDLAAQATRRLGVMALLYAAIFFLAAFFPSLISTQDRAILFGSAFHWLPGVVSIAVALGVAAVASRPAMSGSHAAVLAIAFEVASSYGIAAAEFLQPRGLNLGNPNWVGLSWVAVWMLAFTIVVPSSPRRSVLAALAAASSVPVMMGISLTAFPSSFVPNAGQFFFAFVFPYLLVVAMAYVGARILSNLGRELKHAREMGSYRLVERLGRGGMGEVWRAEHRLLARQAAIKLIRPPRAGTNDDRVAIDTRRHFEREAQATAMLRSPHTVDVFDFGVDAGGTFFYVMELLAGLDAERLVNTFGPLPPARVVHVLRQVCHSLSEAESVSLVHRDIKPANVMLCRYGEEYDFVKVLDFGIVTAIRDDPATVAGAPLTAEHVVRGTPAFMAPEQVLGTSPVDQRADIYGTGCLAYWLLTGQLVFTGRTAMELLSQHAQATPEAPSSRTELPIPKELDSIVLSCLAKNPAERPQHARELARLLDAVPLLDPWTPERAREWWEAHRPLS